MRIDYDKASDTLATALSRARSQDKLPVRWTSYARSIFDLEAKTWTPAFGTMLLAKAVDADADAMSLKVDPSEPGSYSARGLCHRILVPAAESSGFSIRNKGGEPLNNQPFFRYERIDEIRKVRKPQDLEHFVAIAREVNSLSSAEAFEALSAFLRVAIAHQIASRKSISKPDTLELKDLMRALDDYLRLGADERPRRLQAFAAACLELVFEEVRVRRLNDPSRDAPGDVQVLGASGIAVAVEVRGKAVDSTALGVFARHCQEANVGRAIMFVDAEKQGPIDVGALMHAEHLDLSALNVFVSWRRLLSDVFLWSQVPSVDVPKRLAEGFLARLEDIEAPDLIREEWVRAVASARS